MLGGSDSGTVHSTPMSKSPESLVRIDAISIDLTGSMDKCDAPVKCTHFSIRGYVAEMRKKDVKTCFPFPVDCNHDKLNELANKILPPLHAPKFRWWRCQNCLQGIGAKGTAEETGLVAECCKRGYVISNSNVDGSTAVKKNVSQIGKSERSKADVSASEKVNGLQNHIFLPSLTKQKKHAVESATTMVYGTSFKGAKSGSLIEFCEPSHRNRDTGDGRIPEFLQSSSPVICQTGNLNFAKSKQLCDPVNHQAHEIDGVTNEGSDIWRGRVTGIPAGVMEELDNSSSETNAVLEGTKKRYGPNHDSSNVSKRQRARKVRLLTELLGSKENEEDGQKARNVSCRLLADASVATGSVPTTQHKVTSDGHPNKVLGNPKGKRKMPKEKDRKTIELTDKVTKKVRVSKEDAESLTMSIENETTESVSEGDDSAGASMQPTVNHLFTQHKSYRSPILSKKNIKPPQLDDSVSSMSYSKQVIDKCYQGKSRDSERYHVDSLSGFSKLANDAPTCSNRKPYVTKKKNKLQQAGSGQVFSVLERNCNFLDGPDVRQGIKVLGNVPKPLKLQSSNDLTMRRHLGIPPENCMTRKQQDGCFTVQSRDGGDNLLPRPSREDQRGKSAMYIGESSVSSKSIVESRKQLLCELNEQSAKNTRFHLHEMQNSVAHADIGGPPQHLYLDFSGPRVHEESTRKMQEQGNDDIPMEIVELLARKQYERRCHEAERNHVLTERMNHMRNSEQMYYPRAHINGGLESSQEDNNNPLMVKPPPYGMDQNMSRLVQQNDNNSLYEQQNRSLLNPRQMNGNMEFSVYGGSSSKAKEKISDPRSVVKWSGDMSSLESHYQHHNGNWPNPNCLPSGYRIPQKYPTQSDNFDRKGKKARNLDLNFSNLEPQIMDFHYQSFRNTSSAIDLNKNAGGSLDLHANETIPAMQLLSLMDARTRSSMDHHQKSNLQSRPLFPCNLHPAAHDHLFPYDHDPVCPGKFCACSSNAAILQNGGSQRGGNHYSGQVSFGSQERRNPKPPLLSVNPVRAKLKGPVVDSDIMTSSLPIQHHTNLDDHNTSSSIPRIRSNYENRNLCTVNRNPADFTSPGPGNMYMISGKDLKIGHNNNNKKPQRVPKTIYYSKEHSHHQS
ncbi:protein EMBRYONIC FLOWER 1-like [Impatiens glandulifera]|uniref:protein EMBRYONIC FLOWER 1-like n=1 Tax=Impatiens glandulifera TaxID=253017 RepID=UPI001FB05D57|nr:protein EMBRYONIC FLOWER 1-like [Impatiens glandulifera]